MPPEGSFSPYLPAPYSMTERQRMSMPALLNIDMSAGRSTAYKENRSNVEMVAGLLPKSPLALLSLLRSRCWVKPAVNLLIRY